MGRESWEPIGTAGDGLLAATGLSGSLGVAKAKAVQPEGPRGCHTKSQVFGEPWQKQPLRYQEPFPSLNVGGKQLVRGYAIPRFEDSCKIVKPMPFEVSAESCVAGI